MHAYFLLLVVATILRCTQSTLAIAIEQEQTPQVGPSLALIYINNMLANSQCTFIHVPQYMSCTTQLGSVALCQRSS